MVVVGSDAIDGCDRAAGVHGRAGARVHCGRWFEVGSRRVRAADNEARAVVHVSVRIVIGRRRVGAAQRARRARAGQRGRGVIVEGPRMHTADVVTRAVVEICACTVIRGCRVHTTFKYDHARPVVVARVVIVIAGARVGTATNHTAPIINVCCGAIIHRRRVCAAHRKRRCRWRSYWWHDRRGGWLQGRRRW